MLRRTPHCCNTLAAPAGNPRQEKKGVSRSTVDSGEGSVEGRSDKVKSQLCKRFMEKGYCPYEKRCKFAHGSHELRKNHEVNSKYKTKECGSFAELHYCVYGDRCNFIHPTFATRAPQPPFPASLDFAFALIKKEPLVSSRLL